MTTQQPEALRLADKLDGGWTYDAAKELRRLHAENDALKQQIAATQPAAQGAAEDAEVPEAVIDAVAAALGDAYDCTRVWSAWGVGTMSSDDFTLVAEDGERVAEIARAALAAQAKQGEQA